MAFWRINFFSLDLSASTSSSESFSYVLGGGGASLSSDPEPSLSLSPSPDPLEESDPESFSSPSSLACLGSFFLGAGGAGVAFGALFKIAIGGGGGMKPGLKNS